MRIAMTGATGFVGTAVVRAALESGHELRAIVRDVEKARRTLPPEVDVQAADLSDRAAVLQAFDGAEVVVQGAAAYAYGTASTMRANDANAAAADGVLAAALDAGVPHVVDVSSGAVFRPDGDGPRRGRLDLDSERWEPTDRLWADPYVRSKVEAETIADGYRDRGLGISTVHPTMVIGPEDVGPGTSGRTLLAILSGGPLPRGRLGWCDRRDVADAIIRLAEGPPGRRALVCTETLEFRAVGGRPDRLTGRQVRRVFLPNAATRSGARLNERAGGRLLPALPIAAGVEYSLQGVSPAGYDGSSGEAVLDRPYRNLDQTFGDAIRWWTANGMLDPKLAGRLAS